MSRRTTCEACGDVFIVYTTRGRFPRFCGSCDPVAAETRHRRWTQAKANRDRAAEMETTLRARIAVLEGQATTMRAKLAAGGRPDRYRPDIAASRLTLARAVRRVAEAEGRTQNVQGLHELAAEALAWADHLAASDSTPVLDRLMEAA